MQISVPLALVLSLALTGCQLFRRSETWHKVTKTRVETHGASEPSKAYAGGLSRQLAADRVEHKVITYQFRYRTRLRETATGQRTAVIYKDNARPNHPWWLKDDVTRRPVWLPNAELAKQVAFYVRRPVELVQAQDVSGMDGKQIAPAAKWDAPTQLAALAPRLNVRERRRVLAALPSSWDAVFRTHHGTPFDSGSTVDRWKMQQVVARNVRGSEAARF